MSTSDPLNISGWSEAEVYDLMKAVVEQANAEFSGGDTSRAFDTTPGHVNLVGVRGFADSAPRPSNRNDRYDDTMFVLSVSETGKKTAASFQLSTEFGQVPGHKSLAQVGQHRYWLHFHKLNRRRVDISEHASYPGRVQYRALKPHAEGVRTILDWNQNLRLDGGTKERYNQDALINIHYGGENQPSNWSAGCQILRGWENYRRFIRTVESDHSVKGSILNQLASRPAQDGSRYVVYTLVEGSFVEEVWRKGGFASGSSPASPASLPLDLGDGLAPTASAVEAAYVHVEKGHQGGWYPVSENTLWHGGVHLAAGDAARPTVHACLPGTVVAARLGGRRDGGGAVRQPQLRAGPPRDAAAGGRVRQNEPASGAPTARPPAARSTRPFRAS